MSNWSRGQYIGNSAYDEMKAIFECENFHMEDELLSKLEKDKFTFTKNSPEERQINIQSVVNLIDYYIKDAKDWLTKNKMPHLQKYSGCRLEGENFILYK